MAAHTGRTVRNKVRLALTFRKLLRYWLVMEETGPRKLVALGHSMTWSMM